MMDPIPIVLVGDRPGSGTDGLEVRRHVAPLCRMRVGDESVETKRDHDPISLVEEGL